VNKDYQVAIIGAGLAGLALAIRLRRAGFTVVLFEKSKFPFHKLCGEYLSRESLPYLKSLGIDMDLLGPAEIDRLLITNASGKKLSFNLPQGGVGISRYLLDFELYKIAISEGVHVMEDTYVQRSDYIDLKHNIQTKKGEFSSELLISAFGKKSNLAGENKIGVGDSNDYIGIKYHVKNVDHPEDLISMHNFEDGYCGVCRLEKDWVSVCYLSHTDNLKKVGNSIATMQKEVLFQNQEIRKVFENSEFIYDKPITVSNIDFKKKQLVKDHVMYVGDAAGLITPLCGNGMSMALHGSYILSLAIMKYFREDLDREALYKTYQKAWDSQFSRRMAVGRTIQKAFRKERNADKAISLLTTFPFLNKPMVRLTHGKPFYLEST